MSSNYPTFKSKEIISAITKKGFKPDDTQDHKTYYFYFNDEITHIYTYFSHGSTEYSAKRDGLFNDVKNQLKFDKRTDAINFIKCTFQEKDYIKMLLEKKQARIMKIRYTYFTHIIPFRSIALFIGF